MRDNYKEKLQWELHYYGRYLESAENSIKIRQDLITVYNQSYQQRHA